MHADAEKIRQLLAISPLRPHDGKEEKKADTPMTEREVLRALYEYGFPIMPR